MKRILTGLLVLLLLSAASGALAAYDALALGAKGERVRALLIPGDGAAKARLPKEIEIFEGDVCDKKSCEAFFDVGEAEARVVHAAGTGRLRPT